MESEDRLDFHPNVQDDHDDMILKQEVQNDGRKEKELGLRDEVGCPKNYISSWTVL